VARMVHRRGNTGGACANITLFIIVIAKLCIRTVSTQCTRSRKDVSAAQGRCAAVACRMIILTQWGSVISGYGYSTRHWHYVP
jgi:hypothetical protein